jgi:hypothetical protein
MALGPFVFLPSFFVHLSVGSAVGATDYGRKRRERQLFGLDRPESLYLFKNKN